MEMELLERLACGRGYVEYDEAPAPAAPTKKPSPRPVLAIVVAALIGAVAIPLTVHYFTRADTTPTQTGATVVVDGGWRFVVPWRDRPILTGHDGIDREWALVELLYPAEARQVTDIVLSDMNLDAGAWVEGCDTRPSTVIFVNRSYVKSLSSARIGEVLAHEMTHVTQCFDQQKADYEARQREARLREVEYAEKRREYYRALGIEVNEGGQ